MRRLLPLLALALLLTACGFPSKPGGSETTATPEGKVSGVKTQTTSSAVPAKYKNGDATAGKQVFLTAGCSGCHTLKDAGAKGNVGPNLDEAKPPLSLVVERVTHGKGAMPNFTGQLSDKKIADVAAYVVKATGGNANG